jgi:hypothetical protein
MTSFGKDIDDKMKDIRSLLLGKGNKDTDSTLLVTATLSYSSPLAQKSREATLWIWIRLDPHHFGKLDTDPHHVEKRDPNSIKVMRIRIWEPVDPWIRDPVDPWIRGG